MDLNLTRLRNLVNGVAATATAGAQPPMAADDQFLLSASKLLADLDVQEKNATLSDKEAKELQAVVDKTAEIIENVRELSSANITLERKKEILSTLSQSLKEYHESSDKLRRFPWGKVIAASMLTLLSVAVIAASAALVAVSLGAATLAVIPAITAYFAAMPTLWASVGAAGALLAGPTLGGVAGTLFNRSIQPNKVRASINDVEGVAHVAMRKASGETRS